MNKLYNINITQLKLLAKRKKIICFGCGNQGKRMAMLLGNWQCENNLKGYVDNDRNKIGTEVFIEGKKYPVYSLEMIKGYLNPNILLLITCLDYKNIYKQLENECSINCDCVSMDEVAETELFISDYDCIAKESNEQLIPKKIHYAWLGKDMSYEMKKNIEDWKKLCPEYEFYEWNDKNYDVTSNTYMRQAYERKMWGFVTDYMRLDVIYKYGGIYLDTDIELIKKPDELLYQKCFGCIDATCVMNLGSGFGAAPKTDIIRELRDYYDRVSFVNDDGIIDNTSCNTHSYLVLKGYGVQINDRFQNVHGMNIYPMIFQGACQHTKKERVTDKTFWIHHGNMSWMNKENII